MKLYRWLLWLLPKSFRLRQQEELEEAAREQLDDADGALTRVRTAVGLATDIILTAWAIFGRSAITSTIQDLRYAGRVIRRAPGFATVAALTLAIGIGSTTTVFSLVNAIYFTASEFPDSDRLVDAQRDQRDALVRGLRRRDVVSGIPRLAKPRAIVRQPRGL